jgi:hypothetical protein
MANFIANYLFISQKSDTFAPDKNKKQEIMSQLNVYFYGYYFYFASNCEAGSCV